MPLLHVSFGIQEDTFEILEREKVEKIINNLDPEKIVQTAYAAYVPGMKKGYATVNIKNGKLEPVSLEVGESLHPFDDLRVYLYSIEELDLPYPDLFDETELEKLDQYLEEGKSIEEFCNNENIDIKERQIQALVYHFDEVWDESNIKEQLDQLYQQAK